MGGQSDLSALIFPCISDTLGWKYKQLSWLNVLNLNCLQNSNKFLMNCFGRSAISCCSIYIPSLGAYGKSSGGLCRVGWFIALERAPGGWAPSFGICYALNNSTTLFQGFLSAVISCAVYCDRTLLFTCYTHHHREQLWSYKLLWSFTFLLIGFI